MTSEKYKLDKQDLKAIKKQIIIIYTPVILLFLDQIEKWQFDLKILWALGLSITIDIIRRFLKDYTKK